MASASPVDAQLKQVAAGLRALKSRYEMYFQGVERIEPAVARSNFEKELQALKAQRVTNTALRFQIQQLAQSYQTLSTRWMRIARQIEEGTYKRDLRRAKKLAQRHERNSQPPAAPEVPLDIPIEVAPRQRVRSNPAMERLFSDYRSAKRAAGQDTAGLSYESMAKKLAPKVAQLNRKYGAGNYQMDVVTDEEGRIRIRTRGKP